MKQCPKCLYRTDESEWEYCRPCKEDNEFTRMHPMMIPNEVLKEEVRTCWDCPAILKTELELKTGECTYCYVQGKL